MNMPASRSVHASQHERNQRHRKTRKPSMMGKRTIKRFTTPFAIFLAVTSMTLARHNATKRHLKKVAERVELTLGLAYFKDVSWNMSILVIDALHDVCGYSNKPTSVSHSSFSFSAGTSLQRHRRSGEPKPWYRSGISLNVFGLRLSSPFCATLRTLVSSKRLLFPQQGRNHHH